MNDIPTTVNSVLPISEKYALTIKEAAIYFNIGNKKLRRLAEENLGRFAVESGNLAFLSSVQNSSSFLPNLPRYK